MQNLTFRYLILIALLGMALVAQPMLSYPDAPNDSLGLAAIARVPMQIGPWQGSDVLLEQWVYDLLETNAIIHRTYTNRSNNVFLSVVFYADTKVDFHTPEACLGSQGLELDKSSATLLLGDELPLSVNELVYRRGQGKELVYYFYKSGDYLGRSYVMLRLNIAANKISSRSPSGALIRVSTPIPELNPESANETLAAFINDLYPHMLRAL